MVFKLRYRISMARFYFLRGHAQWFSLFLSLTNFTLIFFNLFLLDVSFVPNWLKNYVVFAFLFYILYFPLSFFVGWYDMNKGTFKVIDKKAGSISPNWIKTHTNQEEIIILLKQLLKE